MLDTKVGAGKKQPAGRGRQDRLRRHDAAATATSCRAGEQAASGDLERHALGRAGRAAPQAGRARQREKGLIAADKPTFRSETTMKAVVFHSPKRMHVDDVEDPEIDDRAMRSCASRRPRSAAPTCTSTTGSSRSSSNFVMGHEFMGVVEEVGPAVDEPARAATASSCRSRSPAAAASSARTSSPVNCETLEPREVRSGGRPARPEGRRPVRLHEVLRRLRRRPGGVRARAVRRRRSARGARGLSRRAGALPHRHLPDRLDGDRLGRARRAARPSRSSARARSASWPRRRRGCRARARDRASTSSRTGSRSRGARRRPRRSTRATSIPSRRSAR